MKGALGLNTPTDLFKKFCYELDRLKTDHNDIYAALNVRDAYHLREWIWHSWIESGLIQLRDFPNPKGNPEQNWNIWINNTCAWYPLLKEVCNGSKHLEPETNDKVVGSYSGGWGQPWDSPWDASGPYVILADDQHISVIEMLTEVKSFWDDFFNQHT
jgi:hypothetical protein